MPVTRRQITEQMAGAKAKIMPSHEACEDAVRRRYPGAHKQGASGGWSWDQDGKIVAASNFVAAPPHGRHWLAIRPNSPEAQ